MCDVYESKLLRKCKHFNNSSQILCVDIYEHHPKYTLTTHHRFKVHRAGERNQIWDDWKPGPQGFPIPIGNHLSFRPWIWTRFSKSLHGANQPTHWRICFFGIFVSLQSWTDFFSSGFLWNWSMYCCGFRSLNVYFFEISKIGLDSIWLDTGRYCHEIDSIVNVKVKFHQDSMLKPECSSRLMDKIR